MVPMFAGGVGLGLAGTFVAVGRGVAVDASTEGLGLTSGGGVEALARVIRNRLAGIVRTRTKKPAVSSGLIRARSGGLVLGCLLTRRGSPLEGDRLDLASVAELDKDALEVLDRAPDETGEHQPQSPATADGLPFAYHDPTVDAADLNVPEGP